MWIAKTQADAQADLSLRWTHSSFVDFVMSRLTYYYFIIAVSFKTYETVNKSDSFLFEQAVLKGQKLEI